MGLANIVKFILGLLLILSSGALAVETLSNKRLLAAHGPDAQQTKKKLDSRIPSPDPRKYQAVRDGNNWLNPFLVVRPDGIEVISKAPDAERKLVSPNELKRFLISLPVAAWPYGRVIGVQEVSIRSGLRNSEIRRRDDALIETNKLEAGKVLASLGIKIQLWPSN